MKITFAFLTALLLTVFASSAFAGNCEHSYDTAKDGSNCGGRAADQREGGR